MELFFTQFFLENLWEKMILVNKYYKNKKGKRWVIYNEVNASKITSDWFSWMHNQTNIVPLKIKRKNLLGKNPIKKIRQVQKNHLKQI